MTDMPSPTDVAFVMNVAAGPSPLGAQFAGRVPTREALQSLEDVTRMPSAPTPESYYADVSPRLTIASITRGLGMDPSTELVWQRFLGNALTTATSEVGARQAVVAQMRDARLDSGLQKALLGRSLSFYRSCVAGRGRRLGKSFVMSKAGGEGSRGGHIIGHTKSGKPIYADGGASEHYTKQDHSDAASAHAHEYVSRFGSSDRAKLDAHRNQKHIHENLYEGKPALASIRRRRGTIKVTPTEHFPATSATKRRPPTKRAKTTTASPPSAAAQSRPAAAATPAANTQVGISHPAYNAAHHAEEFADRVDRGKYDAGDDEDDGYGSPSLDDEVEQGHKQAAAAVKRAFPHFTAADHRAAAQHHEAQYQKHVAANQHGERAYQTSMRHLGAARAHNAVAHEMGKSMRNGQDGAFFMSKAGGEGSRGGKIIGHTKSGKPIYDHSSGKHYGAMKEVSHKRGVKTEDNARVVAASHPSFTAQDHRDASHAHAEALNNYMTRMSDSARDELHEAGMHRAMHAHYAAASMTKKSMEKSMRSEAAELLSESLSKGQSGGLPTIDAPTAGDLYERDEVRGGPFPGPNAGDAQGAGNSGGDDYGDVPTPATRAGQNAGSAATTGSSDDGNWKAGVPAVPEIDDWHKVPRLKEEASTAKSLSKSRVYQNGLVTYVHGGLDDRAAAMVKGGQFYHGGDSPQLHGPRNALTQHTMCKSCDTTRPTLLTACPACGDGDVLRRSVQGDPARPRVHGQPTPFGAGLAPMRKGEVYAPGGIRLEKSGREFESEGGTAVAKAEGGAGSRGGNVIGHTRSGKPIYGGPHEKDSFAEKHSNYTAQDHTEAANHFTHAARTTDNFRHVVELRDMASAHDKAAAAKKSLGAGLAPMRKGEVYAPGGVRLEKSGREFESEGGTAVAKAEGGAGSRGGNVIGHTKSGKPIYGDSKGTGKGFTPQDHIDAAQAHKNEAMHYHAQAKNAPEGAVKQRDQFEARANAHHQSRVQHQEAAAAGNRAMAGAHAKPQIFKGRAQ